MTEGEMLAAMRAARLALDLRGETQITATALVEAVANLLSAADALSKVNEDCAGREPTAREMRVRRDRGEDIRRVVADLGHGFTVHLFEDPARCPIIIGLPYVESEDLGIEVG